MRVVAEGEEEGGEMVAEDPCRLVNAEITREEVVQALHGQTETEGRPRQGWVKYRNGVL